MAISTNLCHPFCPPAFLCLRLGLARRNRSHLIGFMSLPFSGESGLLDSPEKTIPFFLHFSHPTVKLIPLTFIPFLARFQVVLFSFRSLIFVFFFIIFFLQHSPLIMCGTQRALHFFSFGVRFSFATPPPSPYDNPDSSSFSSGSSWTLVFCEFRPISRVKFFLLEDPLQPTFFPFPSKHLRSPLLSLLLLLSFYSVFDAPLPMNLLSFSSLVLRRILPPRLVPAPACFTVAEVCSFSSLQSA